MKTTILSAFAFILSTGFAVSQITIQCPADQTVALFDLDTDYESYGDPIVNTPISHTLTSSITVISDPCDSQSATINYLATEDVSGNTASCKQVITVTQPTLNDIVWPDSSVVLTTGSLEDLDPDQMLVGRPEPYEFFNGGSAIYTTYADQVIQSNPSIPYKLIRTWTGLEWCTAATTTFIQVIKINTVTGASLGVLEVETCFGGTTVAQALNVTTDQTGFTLDTANCDITDNNITDYLNCIAEENDIDANSKINVEVIGQGDALNGVSTLDMVITQRHILAIESLDSECKVLAGDVNADGRVSAIDLLEMRKLILGIYTELPSSPSWVFINGTDRQKGLSYSKSDFPLQNVNIVAVKIGDVNGSSN